MTHKFPKMVDCFHYVESVYYDILDPTTTWGYAIVRGPEEWRWSFFYTQHALQKAFTQVRIHIQQELRQKVMNETLIILLMSRTWDETNAHDYGREGRRIDGDLWEKMVQTKFAEHMRYHIAADGGYLEFSPDDDGQELEDS